MSVETADLFLGAVLLAHGGRLNDVQVRSRNGWGKREVSFRIAGDDLDRIVSGYTAGTIEVNATQLKQSLNHLRDVLFEALRQRGN